MAWIFELAVECGSMREVAVGLGDHFNGHRFVLGNGQSGGCLVPPGSVAADEEGNWWISVLPEIQDGKRLTGSAEPCLLDALAWMLYERLKSASGYRFALVGVETNQFNTLEGLQGLLGHSAMQGLVIRKDLCPSLKEPNDLEPFAPNYVWRPYRGENSPSRG